MTQNITLWKKEVLNNLSSLRRAGRMQIITIKYD